MKIKIIIKILSLLIILNNDLLTMNKINLEKIYPKPSLLKLPIEIIDYIIYQIINTYLNQIKQSTNIFELYSINFKKLLKKDLDGILKSSKTLRDITLYLIEKIKKEKIKKEIELIEGIKDKYKHLTIKKLNNKLENNLNKGFISRNNLEKATELILSGANINIVDFSKKNTLLWAIIMEYKDIVKILLNRKNININQKNIFGNSALMWASIRGYKSIVNRLLKEKNINVNDQDNFGYTALMLAVRSENKSIVRILTNCNNIDVNKNNYFGNTALMLAVVNGRKDIAKILINHKDININKCDHLGNTALNWCFLSNNINIVNLIKKHPQYKE